MFATTQLDVPVAEDAHGVIRVAGTRVTLESVVSAWQQGATPEEVALRFPSLRVEDLYLVYGWVFRNQEAVDRYIQERSVLSADTERAMRQRFGLDGLRRRLQARSND